MRLEVLWAEGHEDQCRKWITLESPTHLWITTYLCQIYAQGYALTALNNRGVELKP